jgi:hypothetical protein
MSSYHHIAYKNEFWEYLTQQKATTKRYPLSHPLTQLNQKSCSKIPSTYDSNKSPVLIQNLEFNHLLESLGSPLPLWYFEFPQFSLGFRLKPQVSHVSSFCSETRISSSHWQLLEKFSYNVGIEGFLRLHLMWGQKSRIIRMLNSVQNRISAARPNLKNHNIETVDRIRAYK